ncbi:NAD-binding protein, partial [Mangrovicoccus ximenensis]|uniref:NAD-binding protein n=1 Tax=Mangrovicoccus ximenensis TaxID=1911570 RepID=UPI001374DE67
MALAATGPAPVSGGAAGAANGTIAMMVGADPADYARAKPVLDRIGPNHTLCGPVGAGQVLKLVNNTISTCNRLAMIEGVALAHKNGIALETLAEVLNAGGARSRATEKMLPAMAEGRDSGTF